MNQQFNAPGLSLPSPAPQVPVSSSLPTADSSAQHPGTEPRIQQIVGQEVVQPSQYAPPQPAGSQPVPQPVAAAPMQPPAASPMSPPVSAPATAQSASVPVTDEGLDDSALDEEWVHKARAIVEQTQDDPYAESRALSQVKADYLQRRYGKKIKVNDQS